ncbi:putative S-adenosyl-L-methionine-dependent RNA methyltransferase RSM22, mitochondrial [Pseudocercospora fuligena]|uniref:Putative S-adenosyl-L-methionine-dependent RNA methyltransferase RSM22, mitochondrial n=1 Tax=Pseudocercospora fuligena TaxID=685502 RepID=A0A8H6VNK5_9PEZI|nr:putative S-adenosyl-L-methionine-dependent RNA methyltransferase RSM22, mitochondrial [Pseudocercospora fuligena]
MLSRTACATCRLRGLIRAKEVGRLRKGAFTTLRSRRDGPAGRSTFSTNTPSRARSSPGYGSGFTRRQEISLIESLYTSGQISREEWRSSVFKTSGLSTEDAEEDVVRGLREFYSGEIVPGDLLEDEERVVYERLFGELRTLEVREEDEEVLDSGTGVLRESRDGELEEVEFDEDEGDVLDERDSLMGQSRRLHPNERLAVDIERAFSASNTEDAKQEDVPVQETGVGEQEEGYQRTHPLTLANRFATQPTTLELPKSSMIEPISAMLENRSQRQRATQLGDAAHRIFGGPGMPYSTSTPVRGKTMQQKAITLDAGMNQMSDIEGDVYMSTLMPGIYSSVMGVLVETRKRLGTAWAESLVKKAQSGELRILDAGGAGAGVLAVREMIRAEWERMHQDKTLIDGTGAQDSPMALAEADGRAGGEGLAAPLGQATVLTSSDTLRNRASKLLQNTTFVPRLPDYLHAEIGSQGKFDLVIAPHTLWPLREDYLRKTHVQNLWSLVSNTGGVLVLLEKGVARGFEMIAGARDLLLDSKIASPGSTERAIGIEEPVEWQKTAEEEAATEEDDASPDLVSEPKETGMIIAPCTNHEGCPLYAKKGMVKGRREICAFPQRYYRPDFLQKIWGAKGKNYEDVEFSYLSVMRGKDLRAPVETEDANTTLQEPSGFTQNAAATDRAFIGYEHNTESSAPEDPIPNSLTLPRAIFPPLKRQGHVIIDLCTPFGTLERWTVPRSFSKQAFRDARKANWGDLWALGAKTRIPRNIKAKTRSETSAPDLDVKLAKKQAKRDQKLEQVARSGGVVLGTDKYGRIKSYDDGGRTRKHKVKGVRDKRDKAAKGNGRRRNLEE